MSFIKNIFKKLGGFNESEQDTEISTSEIIEAKLDDAPIDNEFIEDFEEQLIKSDIGVELALDFVDQLRKVKSEKKQSDIPGMLKDFLLSAFEHDISKEKFQFKLNPNGPTILLVVGVNGVGKTTSIGKLAHKLIKQDHKVLIAAGDTFRAAAEDQLKIWAGRANADFIELEPGSKPSAVCYKAIEKIKEENHDILIIDTAGRLQNKKDLMQELSKIKEVINKNTDESYLVETMLVLDATTGQNALSQAKNFMDVCDLNSIILTKFDGTAKAGVIFSIAHNLKIPVKLVGTGEKIDDLEDFDPDKFIAKYL